MPYSSILKPWRNISTAILTAVCIILLRYWAGHGLKKYNIRGTWNQLLQTELVCSEVKAISKNFTGNENSLLGTIIIGTAHQPICIHGNVTITVSCYTSKLPDRRLSLIELAAHNKLPQVLWSIAATLCEKPGNVHNIDQYQWS